jgi:CRP-like cAMP-binding protein
VSSTATVRHDLQRNRLLALLPSSEAAQVGAHLEAVTLSRGEQLAQAGEPLSHVYFPITCLISLVVPLPGGRFTEVGIMGREGFAGLPVILEADPAPQALVCQISGEALRMPVQAFQRVLTRTSALRKLLYKYAGVRLNQAVQLIACSASHAARPRMARWLLMTRDAIGAVDFDLTQDLLAQMLAIRRSQLNTAAQRLQQNGCIHYRRGRISILDPAGLEAASCPDYRILRTELERLVGEM